MRKRKNYKSTSTEKSNSLSSLDLMFPIEFSSRFYKQTFPRHKTVTED